MAREFGVFLFYVVLVALVFVGCVAALARLGGSSASLRHVAGEALEIQRDYAAGNGPAESAVLASALGARRPPSSGTRA